ncbi:ORF MSV260 leucine rich repeat gene family protein, similar to Amsacta moorei entomopoxvirus Q3 ORF SW:P28854 [Melanoplus sanguinipes entomopoxvirus]|uniref:ORF MSV260 leucine rich repeat gene family protein, similar to Amsacta moorei entomopoxvirus Q3 ORF SW:P28854 n=1 Tax=Melanoplus sanguinipes entomopoxvirus TaxID=83191 RepID=Q9YVI2_MSEPV|nr:ORF MSV260 leucine rich repeat gene family protein, similar to Amsacta moorei entomopoxvirus Q3 ORF SW:P28854 [Melanoplus sanguinipes entomopoxvirus]AAC97734.1 ORF MSV260 leucine rich repeat gene family protein, similar to Amsacta moorei entomopoxvirus Q3 ORF SW:P28854 [Melanoplus sanguinipes entomopoxvirus 'O']
MSENHWIKFDYFPKSLIKLNCNVCSIIDNSFFKKLNKLKELDVSGNIEIDIKKLPKSLIKLNIIECKIKNGNYLKELKLYRNCNIKIPALSIF